MDTLDCGGKDKVAFRGRQNIVGGQDMVACGAGGRGVEACGWVAAGRGMKACARGTAGRGVEACAWGTADRGMGACAWGTAGRGMEVCAWGTAGRGMDACSTASGRGNTGNTGTGRRWWGWTLCALLHRAYAFFVSISETESPGATVDAAPRRWLRLGQYRDVWPEPPQ